MQEAGGGGQHRTLWLVIGILGCVALVTLTCLGGLMALAVFFARPRSLTATETMQMLSVVVLGPVLGIPLIVQSWAGWRGRPSRPFVPPRAGWPGLIVLLVLLALGAVVSLRSPAPALLLPPIHVLVMSLLPLLVLWPVGRALRGTGGSSRDVIAGMAGGGFLGMTAALIGEGVVILAVVIIVTIIVMATPGGPERIQELAERVQEADWPADAQNLLPLLLSPAVVLSLLGVFSIPVPLIEEAVKTLATGIAGRWARPTPARAFLWGVASGAGFALAENLFNGALGGAERWLPGAIARFGTTVMHCATGGLVGWGWGQLWTARRPWRLPGCYAAAVLVHAAWNAFAVGAGLLDIGVMAHAGKFPLTYLLLGMLALLVLFTTASFVALLVAGRRLAAQTEQAQEPAPVVIAPGLSESLPL